MSIDINIHAHDERGPLSIIAEYPQNCHYIELAIADGGKIGLYLDLEQWWALRKALPRHKSHEMIEVSVGRHIFHTGEAAEEYALAYYVGKRFPATQAAAGEQIAAE